MRAPHSGALLLLAGLKATVTQIIFGGPDASYLSCFAAFHSPPAALFADTIEARSKVTAVTIFPWARK